MIHKDYFYIFKTLYLGLFNLIYLTAAILLLQISRTRRQFHLFHHEIAYSTNHAKFIHLEIQTVLYIGDHIYMLYIHIYIHYIH